MFEKVLIPTDFSRHGNSLLLSIPDLRRLGMRDLVFLHVINPMKAARWITVDEQIVEKAKEEALKYLDRAVRDVRSQYGTKATYRLEIGIIYQEIRRVAREERISLVVMGSHGHGYVKTALLGSVTQNVLRLTETPLVILKFRSREENGSECLDAFSERMFSRILFPTDFSDNSLRAFEILKSMKRTGIEKIVVAHVQDTGRFEYLSPEERSKYNGIDEKRLEGLTRKLDYWGYPCAAVLREGYPFREINSIAEEEDVSMILMGSHGRSSLKETLVGTVTESVALHHVRPLMIIPRNWDLGM